MKRKLRTITNRLDKTDNLLAAMKGVGGAICDGLAGSLCAALLPGESVPDLRLLLTLLQRRVTGLARRLGARQEVVSDWQDCERYYAEERRTVAARTCQRLIRLRSLAKCMYGSSGPELLGLAQATPREPKPLLEAAKLVAARLRDPGLVLPETFTPYLEVDLRPVTEGLEDDVIRLEETLDEGAKAHAQVKAAQDVRNRAIDHFDVVLFSTAAVTEWLCVLAGRHDLADQIHRATE